MVWDAGKWVTAEEYAEFSKREMEAFDKLPPEIRARYRQTGHDIITQNGFDSGAQHYNRF